VAVELGAGFFHDRIVRRIFRTAAEVEVWGRRRDDPARQAHIACGWRPEVGAWGGCDFHGGHLDCAGYLAASRAAFERRGCFWQAELDPEEASAWPARRVIFCQGFAGSRHPFFSWIPWRAAKGEILTIRTSGLDAGRILSAGQWLVPLEAPAGSGDEALQWARTGSSYDWETLDNLPTAEVRAGLERGLAALHQAPARVVAHQAAVRPIIRESRALIGLHPVREKLGFFNGLGSKGSLHAPFFARQLAAHLVDGAPLEPEADVRRNA
jgi:glycine/D-amino acid oxidase-like deaminating enzyme